MIILKNEAKKSFLINLLYTISILFLIFIASKLLFSYLLPFVIAVIIAALVQRPANFLSKKIPLKTGTIASILALLSFLVFSAVSIFIIYRLSLLLGSVLKELPTFLNYITDYISRLENKLSSEFQKISPEFSQSISEIIEGMINAITTRAADAFSTFAAITAKKAPSFLFGSVISLAASCFIAKDFNSLANFISLICGEKSYSKFLKIKEIFRTNIAKILKGYFWLFVLTFIELTIGFIILGVNFAPLLALLIAVVDLLPVLGTGAILIPWSLAELIFGKSSMAISLIVIYVLITVIRNLAEPKIIGNQIGIHPLFTLLAMFIGLKILGVVGLFILPITLIVIIKYYKDELEEEKSITDTANI